MNKIRTFVSTHPRTMWGSGLVLVLFVMLIYVSVSNSHKPSSLIDNRFSDEKGFATATDAGLKPALIELANRINALKKELVDLIIAAKKDLGDRLLKLENKPVFDLNKYEEELKGRILKGLPSMSQLDGLRKEVADQQANFPGSLAA